MKRSTQVRLWYAQRVSARVLAACVCVHLATLLYAVHGGLSGAEILARTRGSLLLAVFYGVFVLAAAVHAPIGVARVFEEWFGWRGRALWWTMSAFGLLLAVLGAAAVTGVVRAGGAGG